MAKKYIDSDGLAHIWEKIKAYVANAIKAKTPAAVSIAASGTKSFTLGNNSRLVLYTIGPATDTTRGEFLICVNGSGTVTYSTVKAPSAITVTTAKNSFTVENTAVYSVSCCWLIFSGSVT